MSTEKRDCLADPRPGDFWNEMMHPVAVVLDVSGDRITICDRKLMDADGWSWDHDEGLRIVSRAGLSAIVRRSHARCYPEWQMPEVECFRNRLNHTADQSSI